MFYDNMTSELFPMNDEYINECPRYNVGSNTIVNTYKGFKFTFDVIYIDKEIIKTYEVGNTIIDVYNDNTVVINGTDLSLPLPEELNSVYDKVTINAPITEPLPEQYAEYLKSEVYELPYTWGDLNLEEFLPMKDNLKEIVYMGKGSIIDNTEGQLINLDTVYTGPKVEETTDYNTVNLIDLGVESIEWLQKPNNILVNEGKELPDSLGTILVKVNDDLSYMLDISQCDILGYDKNKTGTQTLTVSYANESLQFDVYVRTVVEVQIVKEPTNNKYQLDESLRLQDYTVHLIYDKGALEVATLDNQELFKITGYDKTLPEVQTITATYFNGSKTTFKVEVINRRIMKLKIVSLPDKIKYFTNDELDLNGLEVSTEMNYGPGYTIPTNQLTVTGYDKTKAGQQTITVNYHNNKVEFIIEVIAKEVRSFKLNSTNIIQGTKLEDIFITVLFNNDKEEVFKLSDLTVIGLNTNNLGVQTVKINLPEGQVIETTVEVVKPKVTKMSIITLPSKTSYKANESIDLTGLSLEITYADNTTEILDSNQLNSFSISATQNNISISKDGVSVNISITTSKESVDDIIITEVAEDGTTKDIVMKRGDTLKTLSPKPQEGKTFVGWFRDPECTVPIDINESINTDTIIYAKWVISEETDSTDELVISDKAITVEPTIIKLMVSLDKDLNVIKVTNMLDTQVKVKLISMTAVGSTPKITSTNLLSTETDKVAIKVNEIWLDRESTQKPVYLFTLDSNESKNIYFEVVHTNELELPDNLNYDIVLQIKQVSSN